MDLFIGILIGYFVGFVVGYFIACWAKSLSELSRLEEKIEGLNDKILQAIFEKQNEAIYKTLDMALEST